MKNDCSNAPESDDPLDALLREADSYIEDGGFTARVMKALPRRRRRPWMRTVALSLSLFAGAALAIWCLPPVSEVLAAMPASWLSVRWETLLALLPAFVALASLCWGALAMANEED